MKNESKNKNKKSGRVLRFERDGDFIAKRADSRRAQNDPVSAAKLYRAALEREPADYEIRLALADVLTDMQRFADSNRVLIPYMHEDEYFMKEAYCRAGFNFFGMGCYEAARRCFDRFFELTDEVSERTDSIMDALDVMDQMDESVNSLADAAKVSLERRLEEAHGNMVNSNYREAREILSVLNEEQPGDPRVRHDLALAYMCCGEYDSGLEQIDAMIAEDANNVSALSLKLLHAHSVHDEVMLSSVCSKLAKCDPELPEELLPIIGIVLDAGRTELALELAKRAYKNSPFDCTANHVLAQCYVKLKRSDVAAKLYEKLLNINNNDVIAKYYHSKCTETPFDPSSVKQQSMIHYQLPITEIMENIKRIAALDIDDKQALKSYWETDPTFRSLLRWGFTLKEFSISYTLMGMLREIGGSSAQYLMREVISQPDVNPTLAHEALGMLKSADAPEPFFVFMDGMLLEGKVNLLDISKWNVPKQYRMIFPRFHGLAKGLYRSEVYAAASGIMERMLAGLQGDFPSISMDRSVALSAALEFVACGRCGEQPKDDILERYGITSRRLNNALSFMLAAVTNAGEEEDDDEV